MARGPGRPPRLPSPRVSFRPEYLKRLGAFALRVSASRDRREGAGHAGLLGVGTELLGFRPYRHGEDLRQLDWSLLARLGRPYVRVARREASERWAVLLDSSASMGVGRPGKLQAGAEVATAVAALGARRGAAVSLWTSAGPRSFRLRRRHDLNAWMAFLADEEARGDRGLATLLAEPARVASAGRVLVVGDLLDVEPEDLARVFRRGREVLVCQLLAPEEREVPPELADGVVDWWDAEGGARRRVLLDRGARRSYEEVLAARLQEWRGFCARHHVAFGTWTSAVPFETILEALFL